MVSLSPAGLHVSDTRPEFDRITRLVATAPSNVLAVVSIPSTYLKLLSSLDETINEQAGKKKKLNAIHNRALNSMKQKIKKTQREHEALMVKYKAVRFRESLLLALDLPPAQDPEAYEREFEGVPAEPVAKPVKKARTATAEASAVADDDFTTVGKGGKAVTITADNVLKTLQTVVEARGKKATDRLEQTKVLDKLLAVAATPYARIRVLLALISSLYDYNTSTHSFLPIEQWETARSRLEELFKTLKEERNYVIREHTEEYDELEDREPKDGQPVHIRGSVLSLIERLDDEFTKSLKDIDPHAIEYVERLKDERHVYQSLAISAEYFESIGAIDSLDRIVMRRLEHVYGKVGIWTRSYVPV
jgi:translation initiation factor 3 subunit C